MKCAFCDREVLANEDQLTGMAVLSAFTAHRCCGDLVRDALLDHQGRSGYHHLTIGEIFGR